MTEAKKDPSFEEKMTILADHINHRSLRFEKELQDEMDACEVADNDVVRMAESYYHANEAMKRIETAFKSAKETFRRVKELQFPEALSKSPLKNVPLEDLGHRIQTVTKTRCSIREGLKEDAFAFMRADSNALAALENRDYEGACEELCAGDRKSLAARLENATDDKKEAIAEDIANEVRDTTLGLEYLITETVNSNTLSSAAGNMAKEHGIELPDGIFNTYPQTTTSVVKLPKPKT